MISGMYDEIGTQSHTQKDSNAYGTYAGCLINVFIRPHNSGLLVTYAIYDYCERATCMKIAIIMLRSPYLDGVRSRTSYSCGVFACGGLHVPLKHNLRWVVQLHQRASMTKTTYFQILINSV